MGPDSCVGEGQIGLGSIFYEPEGLDCCSSNWLKLHPTRRIADNYWLSGGLYACQRSVPCMGEGQSAYIPAPPKDVCCQGLVVVRGYCVAPGDGAPGADVDPGQGGGDAV